MYTHLSIVSKSNYSSIATRGYLTSVTMFASCLLSLAIIVASVSAHGNVASPTARSVGPAMTAACGSVVANVLNYDINTNQQQLEQVRG